MKLIKEFVAIVRSFHRLIPEPSRAVVAQAFSDLIGRLLETENPAGYKTWLGCERNRFYSDCYLTDPTKWVPEDLKVESTELADFCQKWMNVSEFKLRNEETAEFRPITPEMNSLRVTMLQELLGLCTTDQKIPKWAGVDYPE
jgi:hypothetical protein